ncbi:MAG: hypothetical protein EXX96DRAFT_491603 [Benjaminiella poitrasii]|nr:MAG: hypothetical protein EXX96DRAFT_491603 [Benjaminiella poitrasii]
MPDINAPLLSTNTEDEQGQNGSSHEENDRTHTTTASYGTILYPYPRHLQPGHFTSLEKVMFFLSSILIILLFLFVGLYARSSQKDDDDVPIIQPTPTHDIPSNDTKTLYCLDSSCIVTAAQILQDVDRALDPCDDFYAYACSQWKESHVLSDAKPRLDRATITTESIYYRLEQLLTRGYTKHHELLPNPDDILDEQLFTKLSDLYASCMYQEPVVIAPLYHLFRTIRPWIPPDRPQVDQGGLNKALRFLADRNIWPLFETTHDRSNEFGWKSWSTIATARRIIEFEKTLAHLAMTAERAKAERWSQARLQTEAPMVNWTLFSSQSTLIVPSTHFVDQLQRHVLSANPRTLHMYFLWRIIWHHLDRLGDGPSSLRLPLDTKLSGVTTRRERREFCIQMIDQSPMGLLLGRYYVLDQQPPRLQNAAKEGVEAMAYTMKQYLKSRVPHLAWIPHDDEQTRQAILNKLDAMVVQVGHSDEIESVLSLAERFSRVRIDQDDFFGNMVRNDEHKARESQGMLHHAIDRHIWKKNPQSTHVSYDRELNKHAFDRIGRRFDEEGLDKGNGWTNESKDRIDRQNECLVKQYDTWGLDGQVMLDDNFADLGGLRAIEEHMIAAEDNRTTTMDLPGLEHWTHHQLVYIQLARLKCSSFMNPTTKKCQVW